MFRTHKQAEISSFDLSQLSGEGTRLWLYVEQALHCPWFYISRLEYSGELSMRRMLLTGEVSLIQGLLTEEGSTPHMIDGIQLVSPGWLNGSSGWRMEELIGLSEALDHRGQHLAYVYKLTGGHTYREGCVPQGQVVKNRVIYRK